MRNYFPFGLLIFIGGCGQASPVANTTARPDDHAAAITQTAFNADGAPTVEFSVPDMVCEFSCVPTVRETLAKQPGVKDVKVELATHRATVAVDKKKFDPNAAVAALVDLQFTNTKLANEPSEKAAN